MEAFDALLEKRWPPGAGERQRSEEQPPARTEKPRRDTQRSSVVITPEGSRDRPTEH